MQTWPTPCTYVGVILLPFYFLLCGEMRNKVFVFPRRSVLASKQNFSKSCLPILIWMNLIGIPLTNFNCKSKKKWSVALLYSLICYAVHIGCVFLGNFFVGFSGSNLTTYNWNAKVMLVNHSMETVFTHTGLLFSLACFKWSSWCKIVHFMEKEKNLFQNVDYTRFNRVCSFGCLVMILVASLQVGLVCNMIFRAEIVSIYDNIIRFVEESTTLYTYNCAIMFCCFGRIIWIMMANLNNRLIADIDVLQSTPEICSHKISLFKRHYGLVLEFNKVVNNGLSASLLFFILGTFVRTINNGFEALVQIKQAGSMNNVITTLLLSCHSLVYFSLFCYISHNIREEVVELTSRLRKIKIADVSLQNQINLLSLHVTICLPKVSIAGFFEIDLHLLPTLFGTTLTYLVILFQFQLSEKI